MRQTIAHMMLTCLLCIAGFSILVSCGDSGDKGRPRYLVIKLTPGANSFEVTMAPGRYIVQVKTPYDPPYKPRVFTCSGYVQIGQKKRRFVPSEGVGFNPADESSRFDNAIELTEAESTFKVNVELPPDVNDVVLEIGQPFK